LSFSKDTLSENMKNMIAFFNEQSNAFAIAKQKNTKLEVEEFIDQNPLRISWTRALRKDISKNIQHSFKEQELVQCLYRPYTKEWLYYDRPFIESPSIWSQIFPTPKHKNVVISCINVGSSKEFSAIISDTYSEYQLVFANQSFPLYYYEEKKLQQKGLFDGDESQKYVRRDAISDFILERAKQQYGKTVTKEDIFYYVYGFLHSNEYRESFANDLKKMLPRLPLVETVTDFWAFSKAGRKLAELHLNYETVAPSPEVTVNGDDGKTYSVDKMRFPKKDQKETINYNSKITISNIPAKAYEYVINGKSAIDWIMERYAVTTHKESGIVNDPNDWAIEVGNPRYILDLLLSIINISVQTVDIVNDLPKIDFEAESTDGREVKLYPTKDGDQHLNMVAEPEA